MDPHQNHRPLPGGGLPALEPPKPSTTIEVESAPPRTDSGQVVDLTDILSSDSESEISEVRLNGALDQGVLLNDQAMLATESDLAWNDSVSVACDKPAAPMMVNDTAQQQNAVNEQLSSNGEVTPMDIAVASSSMLPSLQLDHARDTKPSPRTSCDSLSIPDIVSGAPTTSHLVFATTESCEARSLVVTSATDANTNSGNEDASSECTNVIDDADGVIETVVPTAIEETVAEPINQKLPVDNSGGLPAMALKSSSKRTRSPVEASATEPPKVTSNAPGVAKREKAAKKLKVTNKTTTRTLFGKKESIQATEFIRDKGDLADCLTLKDCFFLGETFWIFTVEQLAAALDTEHAGEQSGGTIKGRILEALNRQYRASDSSQEKTPQATVDVGISQGGLTVQQLQHGISSSTKPDQPENIEHQINESGEGAEFSSNALLHHQTTETVRQWRDAVEKYQKGDSATKKSGNERFRLEEASKFLIPAATLNFLKSIKTETVWSFLSLKKTETGAVCELMNKWREACGLAPLSHPAIAKHLAGVQTRIELAFSALPCVTEKDREWVKDSIVGMTGAAKEFLIVDQGFVSAAEFASRATKPVADELEKWRVAKGMEPLKGTGKIANVSAWKAQAKEAVEAEANAGRVVEGLADGLSGNLMPRVLAEPVVATEVKDPPAKKRRKSKKGPSFVDRSVNHALYSKEFLEDTLGDFVASVLAVADIKSAADLFDVDVKPDSLLNQAVLHAGIVTSVNTFKQVIDSWRAQLRKNLDQLGHGNLPDGAHHPRDPERSSKRSSLDVSTTATVDDPLDTLSSTTKAFLNSIGITTATAFLTARSTDISAEFVKWRAAEGKPELRGFGAIASVSGWKSTVRNKAMELGLDDLAEIDPKHKSAANAKALTTKSALRRPLSEVHPQSPATAKRAKRTKQDIGERNTDGKKDGTTQASRGARSADITLPPGAGLVQDGKALFAVQHRELHGHFVFQLSVRKSSELFVSYRGFGPRSGVMEKPSKVYLETADTEPVTTWALADVSINRNATSSSSEIHLRMPFCSLQQGCGLIEISKHGGYPYKNQDLSILKETIKSFVLTEAFTTSAGHANPEERHNVLLDKVGHDTFHYYLYLEKPVELGQTLAAIFPSLVCALNTRKYDNTEFRTRHIIDEAIRTLSLEDLRSLLSWLHDCVLGLTGYSASVTEVTDGDINFQNACGRRRRLCWVSRRVRAAIGQTRVSLGDTEVCDLLEFGRRTMMKKEEWDQLSPQRKDVFTRIIKSQLSIELKAILESDVTSCGTGRRLGWCARSLKLFSSVLECAIDSYFYTPQSRAAAADCPSALWLSLSAVLIDNISSTDFTNVDMLGDFVIHESSSCTSDGQVSVPTPGIDTAAESGYLDALARWNATPPNLRERVPDSFGSVACIGEKKENEAYSVVMRFPGAVRAGRSFLSGDWYRSHFWRIVTAVLSAFSGNLGCSEALEYEIENVLSLAGPLVISREAFRSKPMPVSYQQRLTLPQSSMVDEYVPCAQPLFLGLVWPALRDAGWCLEAGDSPSQVFFHPKGNAQKQTFNLKRRRDKRRMLLKKRMTEVGLGRHSKTCKRLILAIVEKGNGSSQDVLANQMEEHTVTVADILGQFHAHVAKKFTENDGFDELSRISAVVQHIGTCFDAIAHRFPLLRGRKGAPDVGAGQFPKDVYSGEYLLPFLFALPDALQHDDIPPDAKADILEIAQDLHRYIGAHHDALFAARFQPPRELYVGGEDDLSSAQLFLESKIAASPDQPQREPEGQNDLSGVPPHWLPTRDQSGVTDFIYTVFEQVVPCRVTNDDVKRKGRRFPVGFPGVCCRHCLGQFNEGRYFFSTQESLASCYTGLEKHFFRCPSVSDEIKQKVALARSQHAQERQTMRLGAQQSFFKRLWDGLQGGGTSTTLPDGYHLADSTTMTTDPDDGLGLLPDGDAKSTQLMNAFSDHRSVLDYLHRNNNKVTAEIEEALDRYYSALDYGGRIYQQTHAVPAHFSAEWLIAKLVPKRGASSHALRNVG